MDGVGNVTLGGVITGGIDYRVEVFCSPEFPGDEGKDMEPTTSIIFIREEDAPHPQPALATLTYSGWHELARLIGVEFEWLKYDTTLQRHPVLYEGLLMPIRGPWSLRKVVPAGVLFKIPEGVIIPGEVSMPEDPMEDLGRAISLTLAATTYGMGTVSETRALVRDPGAQLFLADFQRFRGKVKSWRGEVSFVDTKLPKVDQPEFIDPVPHLQRFGRIAVVDFDTLLILVPIRDWKFKLKSKG